MVTDFILGKKYEIDAENLPVVEESYNIACSKIKIYYVGGNTFEMNGHLSLSYGTNGFFISENTPTSEDYIIYDLDEDLYVTKVEFVYGYIENAIIQSVDNFFKPYCNLIDKKSLVYIYDKKNNGWFGLPCPSDYAGISTTLVDSGRNTKGQIIGQVIASDIAKVELKWNFLNPSQYAEIAQLFEEKYGGSFFVPVCFFDIVKNDYDGNMEIAPTDKNGNNPCRMFYCGDRKVNFAKMVLNEDGSPKGYSNVSLNLIDTHLCYGEEL